MARESWPGGTPGLLAPRMGAERLVVATECTGIPAPCRWVPPMAYRRGTSVSVSGMDQQIGAPSPGRCTRARCWRSVERALYRARAARQGQTDPLGPQVAVVPVDPVQIGVGHSTRVERQDRPGGRGLVGDGMGRSRPAGPDEREGTRGPVAVYPACSVPPRNGRDAVAPPDMRFVRRLFHRQRDSTCDTCALPLPTVHTWSTKLARGPVGRTMKAVVESGGYTFSAAAVTGEHG